MKKRKKLLKKIVIACTIIILIELLIMLIIKIKREREISHIDTLTDIIMVDDGYIGVGMSDFNNSSFVKEKHYVHKDTVTKDEENILATQAKIVKYDKDKNIVWENTIEALYDSTFYSVLKVNDGIIAVGSYVSKYEQIDANTRDAIIVKYDLNGKMLWFKTYKVLSDTEFYKIIDDGNDNYIVIGQSIYENMEIGSNIFGGGIILRYDKDGNVIAHNNYGGNKSGVFNDVIKVDDGYIVCGKDALNYGIMVKFKKDFDRDEKDFDLITKKVVWQRTYSNTDTVGFTDMIMINNNIYAVGAVNTSKEKDENDKPIYKYDAGVVIYNTNGKYIGKYSLGEETHHQFNSVIKKDNNLIITGLVDVDNHLHGEKQDSIIVKFDLETNKFTDKEIISKESDYIVSKILEINDEQYLIGSSKSNCGILGCEYEPIISVYK